MNPQVKPINKSTETYIKPISKPVEPSAAHNEYQIYVNGKPGTYLNSPLNMLNTCLMPIMFAKFGVEKTTL